jgi:SAM-dependent methyltransferase
MDNPLPLRSVDPTVRGAMTRRLHRRSVVNGSITLPAVPGMIDQYMTMCETLFSSVGRPFTTEQLAHVREVLEGQLAEAYANSPRSNIVITFDAPVGTVLNYHVKAEWWTVEGAYENWISTRKPPLFGTEPDARVWAIASQAPDPAAYRILDIGGGTGRNTLALARRGHPVDVVEMTPKFAEMIRADAQRELLSVRVIERDIFATEDDLRRDYQLIMLSEVVSDFRSAQQLRAVFELAAQCLSGGGHLLFNAFLAKPGYTPDDGARELGQQCYTTIFTAQELAAAAAGLPLQLVADDSVYDYERAHLPDGAWPPTSWYADWVSGRDVFDLPRDECPIEMRWLAYQKAAW